jgi:tryptophan synthase alpha chain
VLEVAAAVADHVAVVVMCYANIVLARGPERFAADLAAAGASGLIVPDLPLEEAPAIRDACDAAGIALVPLVAPTTPDERLRLIGEQARGFVYAVAVTGTTGERAAGGDAAAAIIGCVATATEVPVALGFGIATPEQVRATADAGADGVIIGSRLVRAAAEAQDPVAEVRGLVAAFADALR